MKKATEYSFTDGNHRARTSTIILKHDATTTHIFQLINTESLTLFELKMKKNAKFLLSHGIFPLIFFFFFLHQKG